VPDDDDVLEAYERELAGEDVPRRRRNRGFWLVAGTMLLACVVLVVEIFANRDIKDTIAHAQASLRSGQVAAERAYERDGSYRAATAETLATLEPSVIFVGPDEASSALDEVSVASSDDTWAAAVQARPGACFYLRLDADLQTYYGTGTVCSGTAALQARDARW